VSALLLLRPILHIVLFSQLLIIYSFHSSESDPGLARALSLPSPGSAVVPRSIMALQPRTNTTQLNNGFQVGPASTTSTWNTATENTAMSLHNGEERQIVAHGASTHKPTSQSESATASSEEARCSGKDHSEKSLNRDGETAGSLAPLGSKQTGVRPSPMSHTEKQHEAIYKLVDNERLDKVMGLYEAGTVSAEQALACLSGSYETPDESWLFKLKCHGRWVLPSDSDDTVWILIVYAFNLLEKNPNTKRGEAITAIQEVFEVDIQQVEPLRKCDAFFVWSKIQGAFKAYKERANGRMERKENFQLALEGAANSFSFEFPQFHARSPTHILRLHCFSLFFTT